MAPDKNSSQSIVLLAAGASSRMGRSKPTLPLGDSTFLGRILDTVRPLAPRETIVVVGEQRWALLRMLEAYPWVKPVVNPDPIRGQLSSLQAALMNLQPCSRFWVHLADHPLVTERTWRILWEEAERSPEALLLPEYQGRRGHPVGIPYAFRWEILNFTGAPGLKRLFLDHPELVKTVPVDDPGIVADIDTPEEYLQIARAAGTGVPG